MRTLLMISILSFQFSVSAQSNVVYSDLLDTSLNKIKWVTCRNLANNQLLEDRGNITITLIHVSDNIFAIRLRNPGDGEILWNFNGKEAQFLGNAAGDAEALWKVLYDEPNKQYSFINVYNNKVLYVNGRIGKGYYYGEFSTLKDRSSKWILESTTPPQLSNWDINNLRQSINNSVVFGREKLKNFVIRESLTTDATPMPKPKPILKDWSKTNIDYANAKHIESRDFLFYYIKASHIDIDTADKFIKAINVRERPTYSYGNAFEKRKADQGAKDWLKAEVQKYSYDQVYYTRQEAYSLDYDFKSQSITVIVRDGVTDKSNDFSPFAISCEYNECWFSPFAGSYNKKVLVKIPMEESKAEMLLEKVKSQKLYLLAYFAFEDKIGHTTYRNQEYPEFLRTFLKLSLVDQNFRELASVKSSFKFSEVGNVY